MDDYVGRISWMSNVAVMGLGSLPATNSAVFGRVNRLRALPRGSMITDVIDALRPRDEAPADVPLDSWALSCLRRAFFLIDPILFQKFPQEMLDLIKSFLEDSV